MELLQLRYFLELAKDEHMSKAAERLFISQPSLSLTIKKLEEELGTPLFDRKGRGIRLNAYGNRFLSYAKRALDSLDQGVAELATMKEQSDHHLLVGIQTPYVWQDLTRDFLKAHPRLTLGQRSIESKDFIHQLLREEIDFFIGTLGDGGYDEGEAQLGAFEFARGRVYVIVKEGSPLSSRPSLLLQDLRDEYIISRNRTDGFQLFTDELCRSAGFEPRIALECDYTLREKMVAQGYGISFSTGPALRWLDEEGVTALPVVDPGVERVYQLIWKKDRAFSPAMEHFFAFVRAWKLDIGSASLPLVIDPAR